MKINPHLQAHRPTYLYGLNLALSSEILKKFQGIRYVLMQGSRDRAHFLAQKIAKALYNIDINFQDIVDLTPLCAYNSYRVGNILSISHGMGSASMSTLLHDISQVMYFADNHDVEYIRIGTSGGIDIPAGVVILTDTVYQPNLEPGHWSTQLDKATCYPAQMDKTLSNRIIKTQPENLPFKILKGNTISADDFYLGQARLDGALSPEYTKAQRQIYFDKIKALSIFNMEMESGAFGSFCYRAGIPAAMVAVTIMNRMETDQCDVSAEILSEWADRAQQVIIHYLMSLV